MTSSRRNLKKNRRSSSKKSKYLISGGMDLNVETYLDGLNTKIEVDPHETVLDIKSKIIKQLGLDKSNYYDLFLNNRELFDQDRIDSIPDNSNVMLNKHTPTIRLSEEERMKKSDTHKFGLCCCCDTGLDDRADFQFDPRVKDKMILMCNACVDYYTR